MPSSALMHATQPQAVPLHARACRHVGPAPCPTATTLLPPPPPLPSCCRRRLLPLLCGQAYLNGVDVPYIFHFNTLVAKILGAVGSVAGGLATGKEGPFVHAGAAIAAIISQVRSGRGTGAAAAAKAACPWVGCVCVGGGAGSEMCPLYCRCQWLRVWGEHAVPAQAVAGLVLRLMLWGRRRRLPRGRACVLVTLPGA